MKFYSIDENKKNLLIYEYRALVSKLYEYKKKKIEAEEVKVLRAIFTLLQKNECYFRNGRAFSTDISNVNNIITYHETGLTIEEQNDLLERYYTEKCNMWDMKPINQPEYKKDGYSALFSQKLRIKNASSPDESKALYSTDGVIRLPKSLVLLRLLEKGRINNISSNIDLLDGQLECFEFSSEPVDSIRVDSLKTVYGGKKMRRFNCAIQTDDAVDYTVKRAIENQKVLNLVKNKQH